MNLSSILNTQGIPSTLTTPGDMLVAGVGGVPTRLPIAGDGSLMTSDGTDAIWSSPFLLSAIASGTIAKGDKIIVNNDGTVSELSSGNTLTDAEGTFSQKASDFGTVKVFYMEDQSVWLFLVYDTLVAASLSGNVFTFGASVSMAWDSVGSVGEAPYLLTKMNGSRVCFTYCPQYSEWQVDKFVITYPKYARVATLSGTTITASPKQLIATASGVPNVVPISCNPAYPDRVAWIYDRPDFLRVVELSSWCGGQLIVGTFSGSSFTLGGVWRWATQETNPMVCGGLFDKSRSMVQFVYDYYYLDTYSLDSLNNLYRDSFKFIIPRAHEGFYDEYNALGWWLGDLEMFSITAVDNATPVVSNFKRYKHTMYGRIKCVKANPFNGDLYMLYLDENNRFLLSRATLSTDFGPPVYLPQFSSAVEAHTDLNFSSATKLVVAQGADWGVHPLNFIITIVDIGTPNMTATNFMGIAENAATDGQSVSVGVDGFIDNTNTGLIAGKSYAVGLDGTLYLAGNTGVKAGIALSSTELLLTGGNK